jgi:hypothetical protein
MGTGSITKTVLLLGLLLCSFPLAATKDRPCRSGEFRLTAQPAKRTFTKEEPVTIQLSFTNLTSRDVYIVPYDFPSDYWVDKHGQGRWIALATGISGPNASKRSVNSTPLPQPSEYRRIRAGETFTSQFDVELAAVTKSPVGMFRLSSVHARVHADNSAANNDGCFMYAPQSSTFTVR